MRAGLGQTMKSEEYVAGGVRPARPFKLRRPSSEGWPETIEPTSDTFVDRLNRRPLR